MEEAESAMSEDTEDNSDKHSFAMPSHQYETTHTNSAAAEIVPS